MSRPEIPKLAVLIALSLAAWSRGLDLKRSAPLAAYVAAATLAPLLGSPLPGLGPAQSISSLISLTLGWLAFAIRWRWPDDRDILVTVAALPLIALGTGILFWGAGFTQLWSPDVAGGVPRFQAAMIPPQLALLCVASLSTAMIWHRRTGERLPLWLGAVCLGIIALTVTRGAFIACAVLFAPYAIERAVAVRNRLRPARDLLPVVAALVAGATVAYVLASQRAYQRFWIPGKGVVGDDSSGRLDAWAELWHKVAEQPFAGFGVGAGPAYGANTEGFLNQHNEYLRLLFEAGAIGTALVLGAMLFAIVALIRATKRTLRPLVIASFVSLFTYAMTDNPFSSPPAIVPWLLGVALATAPTPSCHTDSS